MNIDSYIEKYAVNIAQLRTAFTKVVKPLVRKPTMATATSKFTGETKMVRLGKKEAITMPEGNSIILKGNMSNTVRTGGKMVNGKWVTQPAVTTPPAKEMVNRTIGLHEATEVKAITRTPGLSSFSTHRGAQPVLNDLNIAATLEGKGAVEAANALRTARSSDLRALIKKMPEVARLNLGHTRISRSMRKGITNRLDSVLKAKK
jgi:hypothetical protein